MPGYKPPSTNMRRGRSGYGAADDGGGPAAMPNGTATAAGTTVPPPRTSINIIGAESSPGAWRPTDGHTRQEHRVAASAILNALRHERDLDKLLENLRGKKASRLDWPDLSLSLILAISVHHRDAIGAHLAHKLSGARITSAHVARGLCQLSIDHLSNLARMNDPATIATFLTNFFSVPNAKGTASRIHSLPLIDYDIYDHDLLRRLRMGNESEEVVQGLLRTCLERLFSARDCKALRGLVAESQDWKLWADILRKPNGLKRHIEALPNPPRITFRPPCLAASFAHDLTDWIAKEVECTGRTPPPPLPPHH